MFRERIIRHLFLPLVAPAVLIWLYLTPKSVFGCANRGYMALAVVSLALIGAFAAAMKSKTARKRGENEAANWWIVSVLILVSPLLLLVGPLG